MSVSSAIHSESSSRRLIKPGPAISTDVTPSIFASSTTSNSAKARGFWPDGLPKTIAALVEMSPCAGSRGGSTDMLRRSRPAISDPAASNLSRAASIYSAKRAKRDTRFSCDIKKGRHKVTPLIHADIKRKGPVGPQRARFYRVTLYRSWSSVSWKPTSSSKLER